CHNNLQCNHGGDPHRPVCQESFRAGYSFQEERAISQIKEYDYPLQCAAASVYPPAENPIEGLEHESNGRLLIEPQAELPVVQKWRDGNVTGMTDQVKHKVRT